MDEAGFLQALRENPEDDTTLLVLADWFEERGDPAGAGRSELLRVQVELGHWVPDLARRTLLQQRERELLEQHAADFLGPLQRRCRAWRLEGGLLHATVETHRFASRRFAEQVEGWLRQGRLAVLRLRGVAKHVERLARASALAAVTALELDDNSLDDAALGQLLDSPHLGPLRELDLSNNRLTDRAVTLLLDAPFLSRLRTLCLRNNGISAAGMQRLLAAAAALRDLDLRGNALDREGTQALAAWQMTRPGGRRLAGMPLRVVNSLGMELRMIPAGTFVLGSPESEVGRLDDEGPAHAVTLTRPYYLGVCAVTQQQYEWVVGSNPSGFSAANGGSPAHPVEHVTWSEAVAFCRLLSELPAEKKAGRVYRLPTEAEWEHASRAGETRPLPFSTGAMLSATQANFDGENPYANGARGPSLGRTAAVGSYPATPWGLFDMHGNVWEWCSDWFDPKYYHHSATEDPHGPKRRQGTYRVLRGGAYFDPGRFCRSAVRGRNGAAAHHDGLGLRVLLVVP